jgi:hypothetical protein
MAGPALNYYIGNTRGQSFQPYNQTIGVATAGTSADIELRIQANNGSNNTGVTKEDVIKGMRLIEAYLNGSGLTGFVGVDTPPL